MKIFLIFLTFFIFSCATNKKTEDLYFTNNNIEIISEIPGEGEDIKNHYKVTVHYIGEFVDGTEFDNSYKRNKPFIFQIGVNKVIKGWDLGLIGMKVGGTRKIKIPPSLAYGKKGIKDIIPPDSFLIFEIKVINMEPPKYKVISNNELILLQKNGGKIIDIRTKEEVKKTGFIKNSFKITAFDDSGNFKSNFLEKYKSIILKNDHVIFVSQKGEISAILANGFVENLNKKNIYSLEGGINSWISSGNKLYQ